MPNASTEAREIPRPSRYRRGGPAPPPPPRARPARGGGPPPGALPPLPRRDPLEAQRDPGLRGQPFDGFDELQALDVLDEPEGVAAPATSMAVVHALAGADPERRRLLRVERAQPDEPIGAGLLQRDVLLDQPDQVGPLPDQLLVVIPDPHLLQHPPLGKEEP